MSGVLGLLPLASMPPVTRADSGIEGIIYVVILIIWGIAQAIRKGRQGSEPGPGPAIPPRAPNQMPDELREMLETLTGQKNEPVRAPPPPPPVPAQAAPRRDRVPRRRAPVPQATPRMAPPPPPPRQQPDLPPIQVELPRELPRSVVASMTMKGMTAGMKSVRLPTASAGMAMHMASNFTPNRGIPALDLRDREKLKQAMMGRILLGPPKALEASPRPEM